MEPSSMADRQDVRARVHGMWAAVAPGWAEHADYVDARTARLAERLLDLAAPAPGDRVLELACGPGGLGIAAARRADGIEVVLSDVAAPMVAIAALRAQGLANVRARVLDLEGIDEPDGSFDVLLCREGLMFAADPERAGRELHRVARPGGRVAVSVWGPQERNPWLGIVFDAMSAQLGEPVPPPGVPGPFSLADAGRLAALLGARRLRGRRGRGAARAAARGVLRRVVVAHLDHRRAAGEAPRGHAARGCRGARGDAARGGGAVRVRGRHRAAGPRARRVGTPSRRTGRRVVHCRSG